MGTKRASYRHSEHPLAKHIVIICSTGRTGIAFLARTLTHMIDSARTTASKTYRKQAFRILLRLQILER